MAVGFSARLIAGLVAGLGRVTFSRASASLSSLVNQKFPSYCRPELSSRAAKRGISPPLRTAGHLAARRATSAPDLHLIISARIEVARPDRMSTRATDTFHKLWRMNGQQRHRRGYRRKF